MRNETGVLSVINDIKLPVLTTDGTTIISYSAVVISATDYSAFGVALYGRTWSSDSYRYGFNGKEKDSETTAGAYDFGARIYDGRLGRWLSVDPLHKKFPSLSCFSFVANSPIIFIDVDGEDILIRAQDGKRKDVIKFVAGAPCPEGADQYQKDAWDALQASIDADPISGKELIDVATDSKMQLRIEYTSGEPHTDGNQMRRRRCVIFWNNRMGMATVEVDHDKHEFGVYPDDKTTRMSPARCLRHELKHGMNHMIRFDMYQNTYMPATDADENGESDYTNAEEERVIKATDNRDGITRFNHRGVPFNTTSANGTDGGLQVTEKKEGGTVSKYYGSWKVVEKSGKMPVVLNFGDIRKAMNKVKASESTGK